MSQTSDEEKVIQALESDKWSYRTATGIANETHISVAKVERVLKARPRMVRVSVLRKRDGTKLYAPKSRVSIFEDYWTAFKALSKDKVSG